MEPTVLQNIVVSQPKPHTMGKAMEGGKKKKKSLCCKLEAWLIFPKVFFFTEVSAFMLFKLLDAIL
jgi:hypothetical protein